MVYSAFRSVQKAFTPYEELSKEIALYKDEGHRVDSARVKTLSGEQIMLRLHALERAKRQID